MDISNWLPFGEVIASGEDRARELIEYLAPYSLGIPDFPDWRRYFKEHEEDETILQDLLERVNYLSDILPPFCYLEEQDNGDITVVPNPDDAVEVLPVFYEIPEEEELKDDLFVVDDDASVSLYLYKDAGDRSRYFDPYLKLWEVKL